MDRFIYLLLAVSVLLPVLAIALTRPDLRRVIMTTGLVGGLAGVVAEVFYFADYWQPIGVFGIKQTVLEDFVFGFAITALSATVYAWINRRRFTKTGPVQTTRFAGLFVLGLIGMLVFNLWLGVNSITVSAGFFIIIALMIIWSRPDLLRPAMFSALMITAFTFIVYVGLFRLLDPHWWPTYWLLEGTAYDIKIMGSFPLSEMCWYASWALLGSICEPYLYGLRYTKK